MWYDNEPEPVIQETRSVLPLLSSRIAPDSSPSAPPPARLATDTYECKTVAKERERETKSPITFKDKISNLKRGVALFGTVPPPKKCNQRIVDTCSDSIGAILRELAPDACMVYDIQDEKSRSGEERPFPFFETHEPRTYARSLSSRSPACPMIVYRALNSGETEEGFQDWLLETHSDYSIDNLVIVGGSARPGETIISVPSACQLARNARLRKAQLRSGTLTTTTTTTDDDDGDGGASSPPQQQQRRTLEPAPHRSDPDQEPDQETDIEFILGGITIPERHRDKADEHVRIQQKVGTGVSFFTSQCVYNADNAISLLEDYDQYCRTTKQTPVRIVFTFAPFGSQATAQFLRWLGVELPEGTVKRVVNRPTPEARIEASLHICWENWKRILDACVRLNIAVPLGFSVESVSKSKLEAEGAVKLFRWLRCELEAYYDNPASPVHQLQAVSVSTVDTDTAEESSSSESAGPVAAAAATTAGAGAGAGGQAQVVLPAVPKSSAFSLSAAI